MIQIIQFNKKSFRYRSSIILIVIVKSSFEEQNQMK